MKYKAIRENFKNGDWVFGIGEHIGCSQVFDMETKNPQPFSYLDSVDTSDFRLATEDEIKKAYPQIKMT